jgi:hypothetical protein
MLSKLFMERTNAIQTVARKCHLEDNRLFSHRRSGTSHLINVPVPGSE